MPNGQETPKDIYLPLIRKGFPTISPFRDREQPDLRYEITQGRPQPRPPTEDVYQLALERWRQGDSLRWWEYQTPTVTPTYGYMPTQQIQIPTAPVQRDIDFTRTTVKDPFYWMIDEIKYGLNKWWRDTGYSISDTLGATTGALPALPEKLRQRAEQFKEAGAAGDVFERMAARMPIVAGGMKDVVTGSPIFHAAMGIVNVGLTKVLGPVFGAPEYLVERGVGLLALDNPVLFETQAVEGETIEEFLTKPRTSLSDWLRETYGGDELLEAKATAIAKEAVRISFSWFQDETGESFKRLHTRLMGAKNRAEREKILLEEQRLIPEIAFGIALDPFNIAAWMGVKPVQTLNSRKITRAAEGVLDETLDFATAAHKATGWFRTQATRVAKAGEHVYDRISAHLLLADDVGDVPNTLRKFVDDPVYDSLWGQLTKRVIEDMSEAQLFKGIKGIESVDDVADIIANNIGQHGSMMQRAAHTDNVLDRAVKTMRRFNKRKKKVLAPLFLGWSGQYPLGNWSDNFMKTGMWIGWHRPKGMSLPEYMGLSRKFSEDFFANTVGWMPRRLSQGFTATMAEVTTKGIDDVRSIWQKLWDGVKIGPGLVTGSVIEENMSAVAITRSYVKNWMENWRHGKGIPDMPASLMDELGAVDNDLVSSFLSAPIGKYNYDDVAKELDQIGDVIVAGAEVEGRLYSAGWYLQQLTKDEREAVLMHPDVLAEINKLGGVTSEAGRRGVIDNLRNMIGEGMESVAEERHLRDLQVVGWSHQSAQIMRDTEHVTGRFAGNPLVSDILEGGGHDFDLFRRISETYGTSIDDIIEPMDVEVFDLIKRNATPADLWAYYATEYPFIRKFYPDEPKFLEVVEDGTIAATEYMSRFDDITDARARDKFYGIYTWLTPQARHQLVQDIPAVDTIRKIPSTNDSIVVKTIKEMEEWIGKHPGARVASGDYNELQRTMEIAKHYMWYKTNQDHWFDWANSDFRIDRLSSTTPNLYDIYKLYNTPLESAVDKLDTRSFRDLGVDMQIPPSLWQRTRNWFDTEVRKAMEITSYTTAKQALFERDMAMLDYGDRRISDVLMSVPITFAYWPVHSITNWARYIVDHPQVMSWLNTIEGALDAQIEKDPLIPSRLKGWIPLSVQGFKNFVTDKPYSADTESYIRPQRIITSLETMPLWGQTYNAYEGTRGREWTFINNMWALDPILFDSTVVMANRILPWAKEHRPALAEKIERIIPPTAMQVDGSYWSGSRGIRGGSIAIEPILNKMGIDIPPEGWNPEGTLRGWLGLARVSTNETYWRLQWLANLAGTGEITSKETVIAFRDRKGRAWDLAVRKAAEQTAVPSFWRWGTYMPIKEYPSEERIMRGIGLIYRDAYERYEQGDRQALKEFYAVFPEYRFRQLSYRYWDVASGAVTEEEWADWLDSSLKVNEYYQERGNLERERMKALQVFVPGDPEHFRIVQEFKEMRTELYDKYSETLDDYFNTLADNRSQYLHWRDGPKAQAMRSFLDKWFEAEPEEKQTMLESLPQTIEAIAKEQRVKAEPRLFTVQDIRQELVRNDKPVDAVYRQLNDSAAAVWDMYYTDWWQDNTDQTIQDKYAVYLELPFPDNLTYRESHPDLDKALTEHTDWRDNLMDTVIDPTSPEFEAHIRLLHPDWDEEKFGEVKTVAAFVGSTTVSNHMFIKGTDREMVVHELWRFWTALPSKSLARKRAKEILGPRFSELFLSSQYNQISDEELALWLNLVPDDWETLLPEGRRPPFGEGPTPMSEDWFRTAALTWTPMTTGEWGELLRKWGPPEPEEGERYEFAPVSQLALQAQEDVEVEAQTALEEAREKLRAGESISAIELPSPAEEREYQEAYALLQRAFEGETDLWNDKLVKKWFPPNTPSRRFWQFWYESVPPGRLGDWAKDNEVVNTILTKAARKYLIEDIYDDALAFLLEDTPKHPIGDPREYAQARAEASLYYNIATPQQEQLLNVYLQLPKGVGERSKFLKEYPELLALFEAQNAFKASHPIFVKYYDPDWVARQEGAGSSISSSGTKGGSFGGGGRGGSGGYSTTTSWREFIGAAGPLVMGELLEYWTGRATLSSVARIHLRKMWEKSGTDKSFEDWLDYIKRMWITFGTSSFKKPSAPRVYLPRGDGSVSRVTQRARWQIRR